MSREEKRKGINSKYIQFFIIAAIFFGFMYFSSASTESEIRVYQFSGWDSFVSLYGGQIIISDQGDWFYPGVLTFSESLPVHSAQIIFYAVDEYGNAHQIFNLGSASGNGDRRIQGSEVGYWAFPDSAWDLTNLRVNIEHITHSFHCEVILFLAHCEETPFYEDFTTKEAAFPLSLNDVLNTIHQ